MDSGHFSPHSPLFKKSVWRDRFNLAGRDMYNFNLPDRISAPKEKDSLMSIYRKNIDDITIDDIEQFISENIPKILG